MPHGPQKHHRRTIRLKAYDYSSPGAYFVTICTRGRECVLDDPVVTGIIADVWHALPGWFPTIALDEFIVMPNHVHFVLWIHPPDGITSDDTCATVTVARNGDMEMGGDVGATLAVAQDRAGASPAPTNGETGDVAILGVAQNTEWTTPEPTMINPNPTLGDIVRAFKSLVFTVYLDWIQTHEPMRRAKFWQRNYHEHAIRNERELHAIRRYIRDNPRNWALDRDNPDNLRRLCPPKAVEDYTHEALT